MRVTFLDKKSILCSSNMIIMFLILMLSATERINGWKIDEVGRGPVVYRREGENCTIKTGESGICKRISSCAVYYEGLKQKTIKYNFLVRCSFIDRHEVICCPIKENSSERTSETPEDIAIDSKFQSIEIERPSKIACQNFNKIYIATFGPLVLGGTPVQPGEFPHMGGLIFSEGGGAELDNRCGASLISENYVLTAAHCVYDPLSQPLFVRFGVVKWNSDFSFYSPYDAEIESVTLHPEYQYPVRYHDIALIHLSRNVNFSFAIRPACLYSDLRDISSDIPLEIIGWGKTKIGTSDSRSEVLLKANVTTVGLIECNDTHIAYGTDRKYIHGLNEGQYCAFDPEMKKDSCQSDSGGPMQLVRNGKSTIVGIVSFGLSCAHKVPSVYVRVAYYLDWIESIVWPS